MFLLLMSWMSNLLWPCSGLAKSPVKVSTRSRINLMSDVISVLLSTVYNIIQNCQKKIISSEEVDSNDTGLSSDFSIYKRHFLSVFYVNNLV